MTNLITWSCCKGCKEPDWSAYDALELAGVIMRDNEADGFYVERVDDEPPHFYSLYAHLREGGCEAIHDFDEAANLMHIREQCRQLAESINFQLHEFV